MSEQFFAGSGFFRVGGQFSTLNDYIRRVSNPADANFYMSSGVTLQINPTSAGQAGWRWQCGPATKVSNTGIAVPSGFNSTIYVCV